MAAITPTPARVSANTNQGAIIRSYQLAEAVTDAPGKAVYLNSDGKVALADANASEDASRAIGLIVTLPNIYGELNAASGEWVGVCVYGPVFGFSSLNEGEQGYVSTTAGGLQDTPPSTAYQWSLGHNVSSECFFVRPGMASPVSVA